MASGFKYLLHTITAFMYRVSKAWYLLVFFLCSLVNHIWAFEWKASFAPILYFSWDHNIGIFKNFVLLLYLQLEDINNKNGPQKYLERNLTMSRAKKILSQTDQKPQNFCSFGTFKYVLVFLTGSVHGKFQSYEYWDRLLNGNRTQAQQDLNGYSCYTTSTRK